MLFWDLILDNGAAWKAKLDEKQVFGLENHVNINVDIQSNSVITKSRGAENNVRFNRD